MHEYNQQALDTQNIENLLETGKKKQMMQLKNGQKIINKKFTEEEIQIPNNAWKDDTVK